MSDDHTQEESSSSKDSEEVPVRDERVKDMEQGIERLDDHIEDARDKAEEAGTHDPQPLTDGVNEQDETR